MPVKPIFGYYNAPGQSVPEYEPGLDIDCPVCNFKLRLPVVTISLMRDGDNRSYFFRAHRYCWNNASVETRTNIESVIIDASATTTMVN